MKIKYVAILILCHLIVCSCHNRESISPECSENLTSYPYTIDINEGLKNQSDLKLSDIADSIKYVSGSPVNRNTYFNNEVVTPCYENTVYKINNDSIYIGFRIDWGNLPVPKTFEEKYYLQSGKNTFAQIRGRFIETKTHAFYVLNYEETNYLMEYGKLSGHSRGMTSPDSRVGFINDLDGGPVFFPFWTNIKGDI